MLFQIKIDIRCLVSFLCVKKRILLKKCRLIQVFCYNRLRGIFMIRMRTEQLWDMIYQDKIIQQDLDYQLKEIRKKREKCYQLFLEQSQVVQKIQVKLKKIGDCIRIYEENIVKFHQQISMIELKVIMAEKKRKKLELAITKAKTPDEKKNILIKFEENEEKIKNYQNQQANLRQEIRSQEQEISKQQGNQKQLKQKLNEENRTLEITKRNVSEWDLELERQKEVFYQNTFTALNEDYRKMQKLVVRNIEKGKNLTTDEAKKRTDAVIFDEGQIAIDPPGKTRRLTKDEKEKYQQVEKL